MMARQQFDARVLVHTPAEMMTEMVQWAEDIQRDPGVQFGIPAIDKVVVPMRPGNLTCVLARPGHAKTSLLVYLARLEAQRILERGTEDHEIVVYTTWEQTSEELTTMLMTDKSVTYSDVVWGRADVEEIKRRAVKGARNPIWIIGHGISRAGLNMPRMSPDLVLSAIETIEQDHGRKPTLLLFDYLQLIPTRVAKERVQQVTEMPILLKELSNRIGVPAAAAVQASRDVDTRKIQIPEMSDAQWASSIEQTADKVFGLWRPIKSFEETDTVEVGNKTYPVTENLLVIRLLKQRGERGRHTWAMYFDPELMHLAELETRNNNGAKEWPVDF